MLKSYSLNEITFTILSIFNDAMNYWSLSYIGMQLPILHLSFFIQ